MVDRKAKLYKIICPSCNDERFVAYAQNWNIQVGNCSGKCQPCDAKTRLHKNTFSKGIIPWNKGMIGYMKGHPNYNNGETFLGKKHKPESLEKMRLAKLGKIGPLANRWDGGKTTDNRRIRGSDAYKKWRLAVFTRDNYTCQFCGIRACKGTQVILHADHIKQFAYYPELRTELSNGRTLCIECHKKTPTYLNAGKIKSL